ncbi:DUF1648 domain-containing protein [Psychroserpens sp. XS_ASV72]|uniref:DUF1648 domain-containing protein n=1 Tax=Psychroserpens sp. XS_ASV72 TaxID=3241293 RepID=UPI003519960D
MKTNRPKIIVPREGMDTIVDLLSLSILILTFVYVGLNYSELPEIIPSHFNAKGKVDGYSEKILIWLVPIIAMVLFIGMFIINKYPHHHNYMVNITEDNALKNYRFSTRIIRFTNLFVMLTFAFIAYSMIQAANGQSIAIGSWVLPIIIGFTIILPIVIFVNYKKINKS